VASQVWRAFCRLGTNFIAFVSDRGTRFLSGREFFPVDEIGKNALVHLRGTRFLNGRELVKVQNCCKRHRCANRVQDIFLILVNGSESCKKHDKQLTFIVVL